MGIKYHINSDGDVKKCSAMKGGCPFGGASDHFDSFEDAQKSYESKQSMIHLEGEKKTLVLSDVDGTLLKTSLVLSNAISLHREGLLDFGKLPDAWLRDKKNENLITELAIEYQMALSGRTKAFVKADEHIESIVASEKNFYKTFERLINHQKAGHEVILISGSPDFLIEPFAKRFGFKFYASSYHQDENGVFNGETTLMASAEAKRSVVKALKLDEYEHIVSLGDTASDTPLFDVADEIILVDPSDETMKYVKEKNININTIIKE